MEPIGRFLQALGIDQKSLENISGLEEFTEMIVSALKSISDSEFVFSQEIRNKSNNNRYAIFFVSKHILGADKFLEAQCKLKRKEDDFAAQQSFSFVLEDFRKPILDFVEIGKPYDNVTLYEIAIKSGVSVSEITAKIRELEDKAPDQIQIEAFPKKKRNQRGLYIRYQYFKDRDYRILITFKSRGH